MTEKTQPTDAELDAVLYKHWPAFSMQATLVRMWVRAAMRAAIVKWGTPPSRASRPKAAPGEREQAAQRLRELAGISQDDMADPLHPRYIEGYKAGHAAGRKRAAHAVPAEWLEQAYREGWAACRDAEIIGEEAEDWAFGNSTANSRMIDAQQAAPKQEVQEPVAWQGVHDQTDLYYTKPLQADVRPLYAAPQPAPAELERLRERIARMGLDVDRAMRGHVNEQSPLGTQRLAAIAALVKPKPAPPSDDVVKDAARYRFLAGHCRSTSEHWGGRWSIVVDGPAPKSHDSEDDFDEAVDAALAAQRGNK